MSRVVRGIIGAALIVASFVIPGAQFLLPVGISLLGGAMLEPSTPKNRAAAAAQLQLGEQPRQAILGRSAVAGSLVDAFNYGGKYGTDWEVLVIALADHRCDALEGFFVDDTYVAFTGDGNVAGFNNQLQVFWRDGQWAQTVPSILTTNGPGWTANDRGRGVAYVVVAYKADASDAKDPVWPSGRPRFRWVVRGLRCYDPRLDSTVGGSGAHRRDNPATWAWSENTIVIRHNWGRGIYAGDLVAQPEMLLIGRGLSAIEAPPANVFPRANLCDEVVGGQPRYTIGGVVSASEPFIDVESDFAAAVAGTISQPEGAVEVDPGQAKSVVATFTDADLLVGSTVSWNDRILGQQDDGWINTVAARFVDPAQRWNIRSAPVRRDTADVTADGAPREAQPQLDFVTNQPQAQRIAEIIRRLGRLWGRATVTLPPRFAFIEEGDWVQWQSNRWFGGATFTFRVEAWGSNKAWHHQLTLRQISASVFSDTAPLDDGVIASTQAPPPVVAAPAAGVWSAAAVLLGSGSVRVPNLRVAGTPDDPAAQFVVFEYVPQVAAPGVSTIWTFASSSRPDVRLLDIPVPEGGTYYVAISYVVDGIQGARRVIGPISTAGLSFADGSPIAPVAPANANRVPFSRFEKTPAWYISGISGVTGGALAFALSGGFNTLTYSATAAGAGSLGTFKSQRFPVTGGERLSCQARLSTNIRTTCNVTIRYFDGAGAPIAAQPGVLPLAGIGTPDQYQFADFTTAPANAVAGEIEAFVTATAAGVLSASMSQPMITTAAPGQTVHPPFTPGPNSDDAADITGTINGPADLTLNYDAGLTLTSPLPVTGNYQLVLAVGGALTSGVTWDVEVASGSFSGTAPSMVGSSGGVLRINSAMTSPEAKLKIKATVGGKTYPSFMVTVKREVAPPASGSVTVSAATTSVNSSSFVRVHDADISITLPTGVTAVSLSLLADLDLAPVLPTGVSILEFKAMRESSPGTFVDVGSAATSSPAPDVFDSGLLDGFGNPVYQANGGTAVLSVSATGLSAGSTQNFRFMARVSSGNVRNVTFNGTVRLTA